MKTLFVWCSLMLWLNVAWAGQYHNPFMAIGVKMSQQISTHSSQPVRNLWKIDPVVSIGMMGISRTQPGISSPRNNVGSSGFGTMVNPILLPISKNTTHQMLTAGVTGIAAGGLATAGLVALAASATASTVGMATLLTGGTAIFLTGAAGVATGGLATVGLMSLATAVGTASTGTAIASLSGAAAFSSALAWLGGGALSAGGFGMAGGAAVLTGVSALATTLGMSSTSVALASFSASLSGATTTQLALTWLGGGAVSAGGLGAAGGIAVLTGGAALVVIGTSAAIMYLFHMGDAKTEQQRIEYLLDSVKQHTS